MSEPAPSDEPENTRPPPAARGFRARLAVWIGGLMLAAMLSIGLYAGEAALELRREKAGEQLDSATRAAAELLVAALGEREKEMQLLRESPPFVDGALDSGAVARALQLRQAASNEYVWMGVAAPDGRVLRATGGLLEGRDVSARDWFRAASERPFTGDVHEAKLLEQLLPVRPDREPLRFIDIAVPLFAPDGRLRGVLGAHLDWYWVTATVEHAIAATTGDTRVEVLIAGRDGHVLHPRRLAGTLSLPAAAGAASAGRVQWGDGSAWLTSAVAVRPTAYSDLGWRIVLRKPMAVALGPMVELRNRLLLVGVLGALLAGLAGWWLAARISRPLERLARAARAVRPGVAGGGAGFPQNQDTRELQQLSQSLQQMTTALLQREQALEAANASLERTVAERTAELLEANATLERLATTDPLTGVANRRRFDLRLEEQFRTMARTGRTFWVLMVDADRFKAVNDTYGHPVGDAVLQQLAGLLAQQVRSTDFAARYGGEEFVVLLPEPHSAEDAARVAAKIRLAVAGSVFPIVGRVTVSLGVAQARPDDAEPGAVVARADTALYRAKHEGRDRFVLAEELPGE